MCGAAGEPGGFAPELNGLPASTITLHLNLAAHMIGLVRWREQASDGHALLAAHSLTMLPGADGEGGLEAGPFMSEANGPASRSFATASATGGSFDDASLASTPYGRMFLVLRKRVRGRGSMVPARRRWR